MTNLKSFEERSSSPAIVWSLISAIVNLSLILSPSSDASSEIKARDCAKLLSITVPSTTGLIEAITFIGPFFPITSTVSF